MLLQRRNWSAYVGILCFITVLFYLFNLQDETPASRVNYHSVRTGDGVSNSTLGFEKIFVLNLPSRTDRRDALALAAAVSGIKLDWIAGVTGKDVADKALPLGERINLFSGGKGSWRGHMNAIRTIVEQNLSSALILEDDVDWDIRLRSQLKDFALASQALLSEKMTSRNPGSKTIMDEVDAARVNSFDLSSVSSRTHVKSSPYGDKWDMLWLGHCGTKFRVSQPSSRILLKDDPSVPEPKHLRPHPFASNDIYGTLYTPHTRIVHHPAGASCSLGYALSQAGARKLLYEFGVKAFDKQIDFMLGDFCDNNPALNQTWIGKGRAESKGICVTVQPPLFSHHYAAGGSSDIYPTGGGMVTKIETLYIRWSTRMNLGKLVNGDKDYVDQWPDEKVIKG